MNRSYKYIFLFFLLVLLGLTYLEATEPEPLNWAASYIPEDKIPLGSYVLYNLWKDAKKDDLQEIKNQPFDFLQQEKEGNYFFLNDVVSFDKVELEKLLNYVSRGNNVFIASGIFDENLKDTLQLETSFSMEVDNFSSLPRISLSNPKFHSSQPYKYNHELALAYFTGFDTVHTKVLGTSFLRTSDSIIQKVNYVKTKFGKGNFYLHTMPEAFSNYFLLTSGNIKYAQDALAYLNNEKPIFWDNYKKSGKPFNTSSLYVLLENKPLKWAYYFMIFGAVLFIFFEGKRKQRAILVVEPLKNQNYEYSKTIADLYLEKKEYKELTLKKIDQFWEFARQNYRIFSLNPDLETLQQLAEKSGNSLESTQELYKLFSRISNQEKVSKYEFKEVHLSIQNYKNFIK